MKPVEETKTYSCPLCQSDFSNYKCYWQHSQKKNACVTREKYLEIHEELKRDKDRIKTFENTIKKKNEELRQLSYQLSVANTSNLSITNIDQSTNIDRSTNIQNTNIGQIHNHNNQIVLKPINVEEEKTDHIRDDQLLAILSTSNFDLVLRELVHAVYFDLRAPRNCRWGVYDKNAQYGALEYDSETQYLVRRLTGPVINNNVRNMVDKVNDAIDSLRTRHTLTAVQDRNAIKIFTAIGVDLEPGQINGIKQTAYENRDYTKGIWHGMRIEERRPPLPKPGSKKSIK